MLLAILYSADEEVLATAMACDQQPFGDRYWSDVHAIELPSDSETAYVQIDDSDFADRLLELENHFGDGHLAADAIDAYSSRSKFRTKQRWAA